MTVEIALVLAVVVAVLALFVVDRFPLDLVALAVPVVLLLAGLVSPEEAVSGFSNPATVTVAAMLVMSLGLVKTGAVSALGRWLRRVAPGGAGVRLALLCGLAAVISPFLNNTAVVAVFLPLVLSLAHETDEPPSRFLMPLSFAAVLGGTVTLIGTSTNLIVHEMAVARGFDELSLFSVAPLGLVYLAVGLAYLFTVGRRLLPDRRPDGDEGPSLDARRFTGELRVPEGASGVGSLLADVDWEDEFGVTLMGVHRGDRALWGPWHGQTLRADDVLVLRGDGESLLALADAEGLSTPDEERGPALDEGDARVLEILVAPGSALAGRTFRQRGWPRRYGLTLLAVQRRGSLAAERLSDLRLEAGDLLLVHGPVSALEVLSETHGLVTLSEVETPAPDRARTVVGVLIMAGVVLSAATGLTTILPAAVTGAVLMLFTRCVRLDEVYDELDWSVVFLLAGLLPLGMAMESTGAAEWAAGGMAEVLRPLPPWAVVGGCYLVTSLLTEVLSNNAAAVVLTPVALGLAAEVGMNPYALLVAVMFGASASFMTPTGYQTNTMVYGPGGYRFTDYLRVGAPLNLLLLVVASVLVPVLWP